MSLNLENLPASPATRGRAPKLMTARRRRLWIAVLVLVVAGVAASILLWRYQPLVPGPLVVGVTADTEVWSSRAADMELAEHRDGAAYAFGFSLQNTGRLPITIVEVLPRREEIPCQFNPTRVTAAAGGNDALSAMPSGTLPVTVAPGEYARVQVAGSLGGVADAPCVFGDDAGSTVATMDTVPVVLRIGPFARTVSLPIGTTIGWGVNVDDYLTPTHSG